MRDNRPANQCAAVGATGDLRCTVRKLSSREPMPRPIASRSQSTPPSQAHTQTEPPARPVALLTTMPITEQMLKEYAPALLDIIAQMRGAEFDATASNRLQSVTLLAEELTNPTSIQFTYQDLVDTYPAVEQAVALLLRTGGEVAEADFTREFGAIRAMGPAKMERESPWMQPEGAAEVLFYHGLVGRAFRGVGQEAHEIIYLPADVAPWLPRAQSASLPNGLPVTPAAPPQRSRTINADDFFLEDIGTLLGFLHSDTLRLTPTGPDAEDVDRFVKRLQIPFDETMPDHSVRLALLLHVANRMGLLKRTEGGLIQLTGNRVRAFLAQTRAEQRQTLYDAWRESPEWNDLCRTPGLECPAGVSGWNDPLQTRTAVLELLGRLQPNGWYRISDVVAAIKQVQPDFQRPTGRYDEWSIRRARTPGQTEPSELLAGVEHWDDVEGALLHFLLRGPLHWLGALDLAEPSAGDEWLMSLTSWGARWLGMDVVQPHESPQRNLQVTDAFMIILPVNAPIEDRFRVERFAQWQQSFPTYQYQITKRSLARAASDHITSQQVLEFLASRTRQIPDKVTAALQRLGR